MRRWPQNEASLQNWLMNKAIDRIQGMGRKKTEQEMISELTGYYLSKKDEKEG